MGSTLKVDNIVGTSGTSAPITLSGDTLTATLGSSSTLALGVTQKIIGFAAYASGNGSIAQSTWSNFAAVGTWVERFDTNSDYASGVFQPSKSGVYLCGYTISFNLIDSGEVLWAALAKNWSSGDPTSEGYGYERQTLGPSGGNIDASITGSALIQLDASANDTVKPLVYHNDGAGTITYKENRTSFWGCYIGEV